MKLNKSDVVSLLQMFFKDEKLIGNQMFFKVGNQG
jgi:hypothetical protein